MTQSLSHRRLTLVDDVVIEQTIRFLFKLLSYFYRAQKVNLFKYFSITFHKLNSLYPRMQAEHFSASPIFFQLFSFTNNSFFFSVWFALLWIKTRCVRSSLWVSFKAKSIFLSAICLFSFLHLKHKESSFHKNWRIFITFFWKLLHFLQIFASGSASWVKKLIITYIFQEMNIVYSCHKITTFFLEKMNVFLFYTYFIDFFPKFDISWT